MAYSIFLFLSRHLPGIVHGLMAFSFGATFLYTLPACAQGLSANQTISTKFEATIDSLSQQLKNAEDDTMRIHFMLQMAYEHNKAGKVDKAIQLDSQALALSMEKEMLMGIGASYTRLGIEHYRKGLPKAAARFYHKAFEAKAAMEDTVGMISVANNLGIIYLRTSDFIKADSTFMHSLSLCTNHPYALGHIYNNLSLVKFDLGENKASKDFARRAIQFFEAKKDPANQADAYGNLGIAYRSAGQYDSALYCYQQALDVYKIIKNKNGESRSLSNMAVIYQKRGDFRKAAELFLYALKIKREFADKGGESVVLQNLAKVHQAMKAYQDAKNYYQQAFKNWETLGNKRLMAKTYHDIGAIYQAQNLYDTAVDYYNKSKSLATAIGAKKSTILSLHSIGTIHHRLKAYDSAAVYYQNALRVDTLAGYVEEKAQIQYALAKTYGALGKESQSLQLVKAAYESAQAIGLVEVMRNTSELLARLYAKKKDYEKAFAYHKTFKAYSDSIFNSDNIKRITQLESEYTFEREKETLLADQEKEALAYEADLQSKQAWLYAVVGIGLAVCVLAIVYYRSLQRKKKANALLSEQYQQINEQKQVLSQQSASLKAVNEELKELSKAKEGLTHMIAHDMKNPLNTIMLCAHGISESSNFEQTHIEMASKQLLQMITNMLDVQKMEETTPQLKLSDIEADQLISNATKEVNQLAQAKSVTLSIAVDDYALLNVDQDMFVRVLVNLLTNAIKYSPSNSNVAIAAKYEEAQAIFSISDQGPGIPATYQAHVFDRYWQADAAKSGLAQSTGLGLAFCKLAVTAHNGHIEVFSEAGQGATFVVTLPAKAYVPLENALTPTDIISDLILAPERDKVLEFADRFSGLEIYQVSQLLMIMEEMESEGIDSKWKTMIKSAIEHCNEKEYH